MQGLRSGDEPPFLDVSGWTIRPSLWFDALCLIPLVAGVPFYTSRHVDDAQWWQRRFSADAAHASDALAVLRREITERAGKALPAFLALWTSPAAVSSDGSESCLEPLIEAVRDPRLLASAMRETSDHWSNADEQLFDRVRPALVQVLVGLRDAGLAEWWEESARPHLERRCAHLRRELSSYDLVPLVEHHTGAPLAARQVELCVLRWAAPHAIRVTGVRFLGDVRYHTSLLLNNAVHELLHPPWPANHPVKGVLDGLSEDPFLANRFAARDRDAAYNTWSAYAEEDAAQALDQWLLSRLRQAQRDPASRWSIADNGMHVLALLLHDALVRGGFDADRESYPDFLLRALADGSLWPDNLETRYLELTGIGM